jgi:hypothetical protein
MNTDKALLSAQRLAREESPLARDMAYLKQWMKRSDMGYVYLLGADSDIYEAPEVSEMVAIKRHKGHGLAARVVADAGIRMWRKMRRVVSMIR